MVREVAPHHRAELVGLAVALGRLPMGGRQLQAREVAADLEIDDPGDGVGAVGGRGAPGDHLDVLDHRHGDGVEVDRAVGVGGLQPAAVQQHQGAVGTEAAQVAIGLAAGESAAALHVADLALPLGGGELRHLAHRLVQGRLARGGQGFAVDRGDRAVGLKVAPRDQRTGDDDFRDRVGGVLLRRRRRGRLRVGDGAEGQRERRGAAQQAVDSHGFVPNVPIRGSRGIFCFATSSAGQIVRKRAASKSRWTRPRWRRPYGRAMVSAFRPSAEHRRPFARSPVLRSAQPNP